jgi:hypothetical protein
LGAFKSLAQGYLAATGIVWVFNIIALIRGGDAWLGLAYLLILLIPVSSIAILKLSGINSITLDRKVDWRSLLFGFQGVALAFWSFDMITTFYAIDFTGLAIELNPLGWPMGILGAFAFYGPTLLFAYMLLFRIKANVALYAAVPLALITLGMASMNLVAGAQNFQVFVDTAALDTSIRFGLLSTIATLSVAIPLTLKHAITHPKPQLRLKSA